MEIFGVARKKARGLNGAVNVLSSIPPSIPYLDQRVFLYDFGVARKNYSS
jgi:hypothetical protein